MHTIIKIAVVSVLALFAIVGVVSISKAAGFQEFQLNQSFRDSKLQLKSRCKIIESDGNRLIGNECGAWLNEKIERITLGHSSSFLGLNKKLIIIFLDFRSDNAVENKFLQHLRQTQKVIRGRKCFDDKLGKMCNEIFGDDFSIIYERKYVDRVSLSPARISVNIHGHIGD